MHDWDISFEEAKRIQTELRDEVNEMRRAAEE